MRRFSRSATLSPWLESEIRGTNWSQPILQSAHVTKDASPLDPKELRQRNADLTWQRRNNATVEQYNARVLHDRAYRLIIRESAEEMRKARKSEREVAAWRNAANAVLKLFAPVKKAKDFETVTERPLSVRTAERERREKAHAEKKSRSAKRALELELRRNDYREREEKRRKLQHEFEEKPAAVDDAGSTGCGLERNDSGKRNDCGEKKGRATTLILPFWGCLAKHADELTDDFEFKPRKVFDRTLPAPEKGTGLWDH